MILYNVTVIIDEGIGTEWLTWMQSVHIPRVMEAGRFVSSRLLKVLESPNEGITYCVQFIADSIESYRKYQLEYETGMLNALQAKFPNRLVSFSTTMEFVDQ